MALTVTKVHDGAGEAEGVYDIVCDNAYVANGYPLTAAMFNRKAIHSLIPNLKGTANRLVTYDPSSDPGLLRLWTALGTEAAGASDQSTISCRVRVTGPTL